jgi:hypothetical protein
MTAWFCTFSVQRNEPKYFHKGLVATFILDTRNGSATHSNADAVLCISSSRISLSLEPLGWWYTRRRNEPIIVLDQISTQIIRKCQGAIINLAKKTSAEHDRSVELTEFSDAPFHFWACPKYFSLQTRCSERLLRTEMTHQSLDWPCCCISQRTNRTALDLLAALRSDAILTQ